MNPKGYRTTLLLLVIGSAGYYLCRSSFSVAKPLLLDAFSDIDKVKLGAIASTGTLFYAIGKLVHGPLADRFGGKPLFLYGMLGAIGFSFLFGLGGPPLFYLAWAGNRFVQSAGWGGMVKIVGQWSTPMKYGAAMSVVSLSYLFGDFASRMLLGSWVANGAQWHDLFVSSAIGLAMIAVVTIALLKEKPAEPIAPVVREETSPLGSRNIFRLPTFWMVCFLSFVFTLLRETFNEWTPTYLNEAAKLTSAAAGQASSIFPLFGGIGVLAVGFLSDRLKDISNPIRRLNYVPIGLTLSAIFLAVLGLVPGLSQTAIVVLVGAVGFCSIGPYSLLAGAISLDFGGSEKSASAAGMIDGIGYFGGILSGIAMGSLAQSAGWNSAMGSLGVMCAVVAIITWSILKVHSKKFAYVA